MTPSGVGTPDRTARSLPRGDQTYGAVLMSEGSSKWWKTGIIYQIYPRSFQDSNHDGVGDLPGITRRLPYLTELGINAIWLSPIFTSPMADFGYDIADYTDVDPLFGNLADLDTLIVEAPSPQAYSRPSAKPHVRSTPLVC